MPTIHEINRRAAFNSQTPIASSVELCSIFGITRTTLVHYEKNCGMPKIKVNKYDLKKCCEWYIKRLKDDLNAINKAKLDEQKFKLTEAKANKATIENALLDGSSVLIKSVEDELVLIMGQFRNGFYNLAAIISHRITTLNEPKETYDFIDTQVQKILNDVAEKLENVGKKEDE